MPPGQKRTFFFVLVGLVFLFAALIRLVGLETNPPGLWQDEASTGLDAYLLWTTGRDRSGAFLPIVAASFGDYPLAGYRYLTAPIVGLFGLTAGHERLVAALSGTVLVGVSGLLVYPRYGRWASLGTMVSGAVCPTWLIFSRIGSEAMLLPASLAVGLAALEWAQYRERPTLLWASAVAFASSAYTYHAIKIILPLWMIAIVIYSWPFLCETWRTKRVHLIGASLLFTLLVLPSAITALTPQGMARPNTVLGAFQTYTQSPYEWFRMLMSYYLQHFDPSMLFVRGGPHVAQAISGVGMWNMVDLPFMLVALVALVRRKTGGRFLFFLVFWFLLGPLPGGVTATVNMGRAIAWLSAPQIISGIGVGVAIEWAVKRTKSWQRWSVITVLVVAWLATFGRVTYKTHVEYPRIAERDFQFAISRTIQCARRLAESSWKGAEVVVSPRFHLAPVFAQFHLIDRPRLADGSIGWRVDTLRSVGENQLYAAPVQEAQPKGTVVCEVRHQADGQVHGRVYGPVDTVKTSTNAPELKLQ